MLNYTKSEEDFAEKIVKGIAEAGVNLIVAGGTVSEIMMHFFERYKIMVVKITSKFELKRLCKVKYTNIIYLFLYIYIKYK